MKIALTSPYDFAVVSGVNAHVLHLARQFVSTGHTVHIMAPCSQRISEVDGVRLISLGRPVPVPAGGSVARLSFSVWKDRIIRSHFRKEAFDIVHVHEPFMPFISWQLVWASTTTTIGTFHAYNEQGRRLLIWKPLLRYTARRLDGRIAVSRAAFAYVSRYYPGEYEVIPNGVDVDHFAAPTPRLVEFNDGKLNILFVGRAEKRKGLIYLLAAYSRLKWAHPNLRLIVVGPGNPDADAAALIAERGIEDVVFAGSVPYEDLPAYYHSADLFCSPAIGRESFGMVLAEAMAAGAPVVASNIAGHASVIADGQQGILVPPRDPDALAEKIGMLLDDRALAARLAAAGRAKAEEYRWERISRRVMNFYETVSARVSRNAALSVN